MRYLELLEYSGGKTERYNHGNNVIVHTLDVDKKGLFYGKLYDQANNNPVSLENSDLDILKLELEKESKQLMGANAIRPDINSDTIKTVNANFNTAFTNKEMENEVPTAGRIVVEQGRTYVDVMTREAFEEFGNEIVALGFYKINNRKWGKPGSTPVFGISKKYKPAEIEAINLELSGIYALDIGTSPEPEIYTRYEMQHVGYTGDSKNPTRFPLPAITITYNEK